MANHKRKKPKNARGGCLMCKYWKVNGFGKTRSDAERWSDHKRRLQAIEDEKAEYKTQDDYYHGSKYSLTDR